MTKYTKQPLRPLCEIITATEEGSWLLTIVLSFRNHGALGENSFTVVTRPFPHERTEQTSKLP